MEWYEAELRKLEDRMCLGDFGPHKRVAYFRQQPLAATCLDDDFGCTRQVSGRLRRQLCAKQRTLGTSRRLRQQHSQQEQPAGFEQQPTAAMSLATASGLKLLCHHARLSDVTNSEADDLVLAALRRSTLLPQGRWSLWDSLGAEDLGR